MIPRTALACTDASGISAPSYVSNYLQTDGQLKLTAVFTPVDNIFAYLFLVISDGHIPSIIQF